MANKIVIERIVETSYGEKAYLDSPYEAKDFIKALPWGEDDSFDHSVFDGESPDDPEIGPTHRSWDSDANQWHLDASVVPSVIEYFEDNGFEVESQIPVQNTL
jgi:hypothetical protein